MKISKPSILDKIALINLTTLESLGIKDEARIIKKFTNTGLRILNADFGFAWFKSNTGSKFKLAYKTKGLPYQPPSPNKEGLNYKVLRTKAPFFAARLRRPGSPIQPYVKSYVILPISYRTHTYGNIILCFKKNHNFTQEEKSLSAALGNATAQAIALSRLHHNLRDIKHTLDNTPEPLLIFDPISRRVSYLNKSLLDQTGLKKSQLTNAQINKIIHSSFQKIFQKRLNRIVSQKIPSSIFEVTLTSQAHQKIPAEMSLQYVNLPGQSPHLLAIFRDLREIKKGEKKIRHAAFHDSLTGLPNRPLFTKKLNASIRSGQKEHKKFAVLFMDLDRFKLINDALGHLMGDQLLKQVAQRLKKNIKRSDTVSRFGGDEFVVLLTSLVSFKQVDQVIERIQATFQDPFKLSNKFELYLTFSIGISTFPKDGATANVLLNNADDALYQAKQEGGNNYKYYDSKTTALQPVLW